MTRSQQGDFIDKLIESYSLVRRVYYRVGISFPPFAVIIASRSPIRTLQHATLNRSLAAYQGKILKKFFKIKIMIQERASADK